MKALIKENKVVQLSGNDFPVHPSFSWMDAPEGCAVGWVLIGGQLQLKPEPQKTQVQLIDEYKQAMQSHIDKAVRAKNYNDGFACASYANSTNQDWKNEALVFIAWRDACWQYAIDIQNQVEGEEIESPSLEDFISNIPTFNWTSE